MKTHIIGEYENFVTGGYIPENEESQPQCTWVWYRSGYIYDVTDKARVCVGYATTLAEAIAWLER